MRLILHTNNPASLRTTLGLILGLRKQVTFRCTEKYMVIISVNERATEAEPQVWCRLKMLLVFHEVNVKSVRDNIVEFEVNVDQLLLVLRTFDRELADTLVMKLQRQEGTQRDLENRRVASLALLYTSANAMGTADVTHTYKLPTRILSALSSVSQMVEPRVDPHSLIVELPGQFTAVYKRLSKFRRTGETLHIHMDPEHGMLFALESEGKFRVTITYNEKIKQIQTAEIGNNPPPRVDRARASVKVADWLGTAKLVGTCRSNYFVFADRDCVLHSHLEDNNDVELKYYINGFNVNID